MYGYPRALRPSRVSFKHSASFRLGEQSLANFFHTGKATMSYQDRTLTCVECGQSFIFTADDQSYHAEKGYTNEPKRCNSCRQARRATRSSDGFGYDRGPREMHTVVCAECGKRGHRTVPAPRRPARLLQRLLQSAGRRHRWWWWRPLLGQQLWRRSRASDLEPELETRPWR